MKLTMVIPTFTLTKEVEDRTVKAIDSYRDYIDELIITEDGGNYSKTLQSLSDTYIYNKENEGFTANVNRGWRFSTGDFTAIVNSDTYRVAGDLRDLCVEGCVTSPKSWNEPLDNHTVMLGYFFVVPKEIKKERGLLMEDMKMYGSDSEYQERIADIYRHIPEVEIMHDWNKSSNQVEGLWEQMKAQQEEDTKMLNEVIKKGDLLENKRKVLQRAE